MKKIEAIIRPEKLDDVISTLESVGYSGVMITEIRGHGKQKGLVQKWRGEEYRVPFLAKIKVEIVARNKDVEKIIKAVIAVARTGEIGDGKIFIYPAEDAVKIRTGESGEDIV